MCVFTFTTTFSEMFLSLRRTERNVIESMYWSSCKVPVILVRFYWNIYFRDRFSKNTQISYFIKIRPVEAELFNADRRADGQTDMKLIVAFSQFC